MVAAPGGEDASPLSQMMAAVEVVLQGIGEDVQREGLRKTPLRVASAFQEALAGYQLSASEIIGPALFTEAGTGGGTGCGGGSGGIVVVSNIDCFALCESCLLPFRLRCHVAYIPCGQRVVGLSKFPRVADVFAKRLQNPQKFADDLVGALDKSFMPLGVGVVVESWHLQWPGLCEGHKVPVGGSMEERLEFGWVPLAVHSGKGQFENLHCSLWDEFLTILQLEGADVEWSNLGATDGPAVKRKSCPFLLYDRQGIFSLLSVDSTSPEVSLNGCSGGVGLKMSLSNGVGLKMSTVSASATAMAVGVESLLRLVRVVDLSKEELRCSALRFVNWILAATQGSRGSESFSQDHGLIDCYVTGTAVESNGNGLMKYGNGSLKNGVSANDRGLKGSSSGLTAIHSNGMGHGSKSLSRCYVNGTIGQSNGSGSMSYGNGSISNGDSANDHGWKGSGKGSMAIHGNGKGYGSQSLSNGTSAAQSNRNSHLIDGTLSNALNHNHMTNGSVSVLQKTSNDALHCTVSNLSGPEVISEVDNFSEGLLCLELDISFSSLCEHHLLPFFGVVHLGYICTNGSRHMDRSFVLEIVAMYSRRLQVQERLTRQIVEEVVLFAGLQGAIVVAEASHMCMMSRGVVKLGCSTATVATIGKFSIDGAIRASFLKRLPRKRTKKMAH